MTSSNQSVSRLITYLATHPSLDRLAQFLVLDAFCEQEPRSAVISSFDHDGHVHLAGSFGLSREAIQGFQNLSFWDHAPAVDVIRRGKPVFLLDGNAVATEYPWLEKYETLLHPTIAWPLSHGEERLGALQVHFNSSFNEMDMVPLLTSLTPVIALYMGLSVNGHDSPNGSHTYEEPQVANNHESLTERQLIILRMMAQGMTNPQIAGRIGFSDSTVRQETMAIYRHLGASGRREAARIAHMRGLLSEQDSRVSSLPIPS
jgi:DNA-binding CsgD family transcriptional regulator